MKNSDYQSVHRNSLIKYLSSLPIKINAGSVLEDDETTSNTGSDVAFVESNEITTTHIMSKQGDATIQKHPHKMIIPFVYTQENTDDDAMNDEDEKLAADYLLRNNYIRRHTIGS